MSYFAADLHWDNLAWYRRAVGCYRTAVGYYRVIAQKTLESKSSHQNLLKTQKIIEIGPITAENDKNEKMIKHFEQKGPIFLDFPVTLRSDNDRCQILA